MLIMIDSFEFSLFLITHKLFVELWNAQWLYLLNIPQAHFETFFFYIYHNNKDIEINELIN